MIVRSLFYLGRMGKWNRESFLPLNLISPEAGGRKP